MARENAGVGAGIGIICANNIMSPLAERYLILISPEVAKCQPSPILSGAPPARSRAKKETLPFVHCSVAKGYAHQKKYSANLKQSEKKLRTAGAVSSGNNPYKEKALKIEKAAKKISVLFRHKLGAYHKESKKRPGMNGR